MKKLGTLSTIILTVLTIAFSTAKAQDVIVTTSGKAIKAHVKKANSDYVVYTKLVFDRRKIKTGKVLYIQYGDGTKKVFRDISMAKHYKNYSALAKSSSTPIKADTLATKTGANTPQVHTYYIERLGSNFRLDSNQIVGIGKINDIMSQSVNPAVIAELKLAKTMRMLTTIATLASIPGSASGSFASFVTFKNLFNELKAGNASAKSYIGAGLSFTATLALPITSGILKHKRNKLYDKTITMYSSGR